MPDTSAGAIPPRSRSRLSPPATPASAYATVTDWCRISGMGRSATYEALGRGDLRAVKLGQRTLVDVQRGLTWLDARPVAAIRPHSPKQAA